MAAVVACEASRLLPSLALFLSFFLLGVFVSALGPAVPSLSRDIGITEASFGTAFSLRGLGYLLGSWFSSVTWLPVSGRTTRLQQALNNRMNRLGAATAGLGLFSLALDTAGALWLVSVWCFFQGFCGGAIDAMANAAISAVHGTSVAPWMQGLHFCFSAGALVAPAAVGLFGYRAVFFSFGLLAMPAALTCCCLADGTRGACVRRGRERQHRLLVELEESSSSVDDRTTCGEDIRVVEAIDGRSAAAEAVEHRLPRTNFTCITESARPRAEGLREMPQAASPSFRGEGLCSQATKETTTRKGKNEGHVAPLGRIAASSGVPTAHQLQEEEEEEEEEEEGEDEEGYQEHTRLNTSISYRIGKAARNVEVLQQPQPQQQQQQQQQRQRQEDSGETAPLPQGEEDGKIPPFSLVALLALFFFFYVGAEVGFGAWVAVVVLRDNLAGEAGAALMASIFWGGITMGRLLAVPLAVRFSAGLLLRVNLLGGLLSAVLLLAAGRDGIVWAAVGTGLFGLFMASTYPLAMSLLSSNGFILSDKSSSRMVVGGALGEMLVPALIAALLGPNDGGWPTALYAVCLAISGLLVIVYGAWCIVLEALSWRGGQERQSQLL